jgi:hypothetical protein
MFNKIFIPALVFVNTIVTVPATEAAESNCTQNRVDGTTIPATVSYIYPAQTVAPFYQWENDNGYCGEVSMIQAGLNNGQWMSQYNARLVCGAALSQSGPGSQTGLSQSGPGNWCSNHKNIPNYNAQLLIEDPDTSVSGPNPYANVPTCLANARLSGTTYPYSSGANLGLSGYQDFMSWVKSEVIAGHQVTVGVLLKYGTDPQYDHEVSVIKIGTNHGTVDPTYYDDDVLYFDDHGAYALVGTKLNKGNPAVPYGAGTDMTGCTPYVFGYTFGSLPQTRKGANATSAEAYSIIIPGVKPTYTSTGADGYLGTVPITGHNYGYSVSGAIDNSSDGIRHLMPIQLSIVSATYTNLAANPKDPIAGWQYENSMIGTDIMGMSCTNNLPQYWMTMNPPPPSPLVTTLQVTVSGLTKGTSYNLYEYDIPANVLSSSPTGPAAALSAVPTGDFNRNASMATYVTRLTATGSTYSLPQAVRKTSDQIIVFRAVPANAP